MTTVAIMSCGFNEASGQATVVSRRVESLEDVKKGVNEIEVLVNNIVCCFSVGCQLDLTRIAKNGRFVEYKDKMETIIMTIRRPVCTATIWASGKINVLGATTESDAKTGARRCARALQNLGFDVKFTKYRIVNVVASCRMPFAIKIVDFVRANPKLASYEPEVHPGMVYKNPEIPASLQIFSSGNLNIFSGSVEKVIISVEQLYSKVFEFKRERHEDHPAKVRLSVEKDGGPPSKKARYEVITLGQSDGDVELECDELQYQDDGILMEVTSRRRLL